MAGRQVRETMQAHSRAVLERHRLRKREPIGRSNEASPGKKGEEGEKQTKKLEDVFSLAQLSTLWPIFFSLSLSFFLYFFPMFAQASSPHDPSDKARGHTGLRPLERLCRADMACAVPHPSYTRSHECVSERQRPASTSLSLALAHPSHHHYHSSSSSCGSAFNAPYLLVCRLSSPRQHTHMNVNSALPSLLLSHLFLPFFSLSLSLFHIQTVMTTGTAAEKPNEPYYFYYFSLSNRQFQKEKKHRN